MRNKGHEKLNILFMSLLDFSSYEERNIYTDLLKEFEENGHTVYAISPTEIKNKKKVITVNKKVIKPVIGNIQKVGIIEKGISTLRLEKQVLNSIKKNLTDIVFDIVLFTTPPINLSESIRYLKKKNNVMSYLLLKDIFPQNALDLGMLSKHGLKGIIYRYFKTKEKNLYLSADVIGCMSPANKTYLLSKNDYLKEYKVEVNPNSEKCNMTINDKIDRKKLLDYYGIPFDKKVFIYGGNLGKPQGIDFVIDVIKYNETREKCYFVIVGSGTELNKLITMLEHFEIKNTKIIHQLSKDDYESLVSVCDVGMIFLDYRFTIPNFPSRILSYLKFKIPVLIASDPHTDIGKIAQENDFGRLCYSNSPGMFNELVEDFMNTLNIQEMGQKGYNYYINHYQSNHSYELIMNRYEEYINEI